MIKTGSKFLFGLSAFALVLAVAWAGATGGNEIGVDSILGPLTFGYKGYVGEHIGYAILMGLCLTSLALGVFLTALRDADPEAEAQVVGLEAVPEVVIPATINYWPVVAAFSVGAIALGLAVGPIMFVVGMVGLAICTVEWAVRAWADRATGDPEVNRSIRNRLMNPIEVPVGAALVVGAIVLAVSRILLALPKVGGYVVFGLVPAIVLAIGALIVMRPRLSQSVIAGVLLVGGLAILAGGVAAGIAGEREHGGDHEGSQSEEGLAPLPAPAFTVITSGR